jgi:hypothetical protein
MLCLPKFQCCYLYHLICILFGMDKIMRVLFHPAACHFCCNRRQPVLSQNRVFVKWTYNQLNINTITDTSISKCAPVRRITALKLSFAQPIYDLVWMLCVSHIRSLNLIFLKRKTSTCSTILPHPVSHTKGPIRVRSEGSFKLVSWGKMGSPVVRLTPLPHGA